MEAVFLLFQSLPGRHRKKQKAFFLAQQSCSLDLDPALSQAVLHGAHLAVQLFEDSVSPTAPWDGQRRLGHRALLTVSSALSLTNSIMTRNSPKWLLELTI